MGKSEDLSATVFCFEGFRLDAIRRTLHRNGAPVELRAKCFDLLACLARNAGRVVTKDELTLTVWPNVVVTDESITRCVSDIRHALSDGAQQIVKTVPRQGYMLASPVSFGDAVEIPRRQVDQVAVRAEPAVRGRGWLAAAAVACTAAIAALVLVVWQPWVAPPTSTPALSIIVLPLSNRGDDPGQAYFVEGLTDDLTTDVSRIPGSFVIARSTAETYKGKAVDVRQIGREVGVRYVLEGSAQRLDEVVRLNLRLIDAESGRELWADRIDGNRSELAKLQATVTGTVARALHVKMVEAESERSLRLRPRDPGAQDLVWQARTSMERRTTESIAAAREQLLRAVKMDPASVSAWSGLSRTYTLDTMQRLMKVRGADLDEWVRRAGEAADKAYALDPNHPEALYAMGAALQARGQPEQALAMFLRQVEVDPNDAPGWHSVGYSYAELGKPEESIAANERALRLSPRDGRLNSFCVTIAAAHLHAGRDREAMTWARRAIAARPGFSISYAWLAAAAANIGDTAAAREAIAEFKRLQPDYTLQTFKDEKHGNNPAFLAQRERFYQGLALAGLK
jgi:TolB-like protein/DNA-binding winged helix-turn-helix (wHTH) protein/tetratricopeptide (TPR) repeat protein